MDEERKFNPVSSQAKDGIKPEFGSGGETSDEKKAADKTGANQSAAEELGGSEKAAENAGTNTESKQDDNLSSARKSEETPGGLYSGTGKSENEKAKKRRFGGVLKKRGPIIAIFMMIFGVGGVSFLGISTEIIAWKENIYSMFGQNSAIINRRSNFIMRRLLSTNRSTTTDTIFGKTKFKINASLDEKLKAKGINYIEDADGSGLKVLAFEDTDGRLIPIVASDSDLPKAKALAGTEVEINGKTLKYSGDSMTLSEAKVKNKNFSVSYDDATITFTGKIAGWFDNMADSMYERLIGKKARNQTQVDDPDEENVNKMLLGNASEGLDEEVVEGTSRAQKIEDGKPVEDGQGKPVYEINDTELEEIKAGNGKIKPDDPGVESVGASLTARARKVAMMSSNMACAILKSAGALSAAVGAVQTMNVINIASKYLEIADKIKAGDADETVNIALNNLNENMVVRVKDLDGKVVEVVGAVTNSDGWNQVFSKTNIVNENDVSAKLMNRELATKSALMEVTGSSVLSSIVGSAAGFGASITAFRACSNLQMAAGAISFIADVGGFFTLGVTKFVKDFIRGAIQGAVLAAAMVTIGTIVNAVTPMIARWFAGTLSELFLGKNGGFALLSGAQNIMNSNLQMSTGRYADNNNAVEVFALTMDVEREWAAYERATRSPLDITSKYTFLGSIYNSILPIINTSSSNITGTMSSVLNLTGTSLLALTGESASAANEIDKFSMSLASEGHCGSLQAAGVAGDFACNKYVGAYVNELTTVDPETVYERMARYGSFNGVSADGNPKVDPKSEYARYLVACVASDTQPGMMSGVVQGFMNKMTTTGNDVVNGVINFGRNFVPFEGALDFVQAIEDKTYMVWNSGVACTGNTNDEELNKKVKDYSTYNLDQRVLYDMGIIEENSTVAFLNEYYEENPLDDSFEGRIARFSGMSKEEVEDTLALIEYYEFLDNYEPAGRYAFGSPVVNEGKEIKFDNENKIAGGLFILLNEISFADVRNRVLTV